MQHAAGPALATAHLLCLRVRRVLDPGVFLQPLGDKFVRLTLQLLARYTSWLAAGLQQPEAPEAAPASDGTEEQVPPQLASLSQSVLQDRDCTAVPLS